MKFAFYRDRLSFLKPILLRLCLLLVGATLLAGGAFAIVKKHRNSQTQSPRSAQKTKQRATPRPLVAKKAQPAEALEYSSEEGEDVDGRQSWFMFQRTYPFAD